MKAFLYRACAIIFSHFVLYPDYRISFFIPLAFRFADYKLKKTFITVICLVSLSTIMDTAGMISVIATALAVATGSLYPLFAPVIGCLGTFITGSDTSSNILFGKLQANVAGHIQVSPDWLSAANTVGATGGKIISPQSIAIATSAGNQQGKEGEILKSAIPYALAYVLITGVIVYIFS